MTTNKNNETLIDREKQNMQILVWFEFNYTNELVGPKNTYFSPKDTRSDIGYCKQFWYDSSPRKF